LIDVALVHLAAPDQEGNCSLGTSVDIAKAAVESAPVVLAQINSQMPWVHGDSAIPRNHLTGYIEVSRPLPQASLHPLTPEEIRIGERVAELVENGACLQVGIGAIPNAVLAALKSHRHLGLHTEMWSDGALKLIQTGVIDNSRKEIHEGKSVSSFIIGSQEVYDFIHDNPAVIQMGTDYVNNPDVIARNSHVTAINSAVEIDLTGQVCADSIGHKIISGVGGQMDFMRGAALSRGGKPIIALTSRTRRGQSRIVTELKPGAGVVSTRANVHHVVSEYGSVDLHGKTLRERAMALIEIAHPEDRELLQRNWHESKK
jgi:acyl-CoA hydrolase